MNPNQSPTPESLIEPLSQREMEILALLAQQRTNREIADALCLSLNTVKWYARQLYAKLGVANRREAVARAHDLDLWGADEPEPIPPGNLPAQLTPFLGRQQELAQLRRLLAAPGCRLLTITGPGGMGKTRLALRLARLQQQARPSPFPHGVFFAPLDELVDAASAVSAMAGAVGLRFYAGDRSPVQQLAHFLRRKQALLVLDNLEHLASEEMAAILVELLAAAPDLVILATSRTRLNIQGEQTFPLGGLAWPADASEGLGDFSSIQLFTDAARRVDPDFVLHDRHAPAVIAICRLVDGMPLAIELAAAWTAVLTPAEILGEIEQGLDLLASDAANIPARQRSLSIILDASWRSLSREERRGAKWLSVFRDGFDGRAARQAAQASARTLLGLSGKGWLQRDREGRYRLHTLLRQYAAGKLGEDPAEEAAAREAHSRHYCRWLAEMHAEVLGGDQQHALDSIGVDLENAQSATLWAARHGLTEHLDQAIPALGLYHRWCGNFVAGDGAFQRLAEALSPPADEAGWRALARLLTWRCAYRGLRGDNQESLRLGRLVLSMIAAPELAGQETRDLQAVVALQQGYAAMFASAAEARPHFVRSYALYEAMDDAAGMALALVGLGRMDRNLYRTAEAEEAFRQAIRLHERAGNQLGYSDALTSLGSTAYWQGRFQDAERLLRQGLSAALPADRDAVGNARYWLARTYHEQGRFTEAAAEMKACLALRQEQGMEVFAVIAGARVGAIYRDQGRYERARAMGETTLAEAQTIAFPRGTEHCLMLLGSVDLAEGRVERAYERLCEGLALPSLPSGPVWYTPYWAWQGLAALARGRDGEARERLLAEMNHALAFRLYASLLMALAGLALLLARGEDRREQIRALELLSLLEQHPYAARAAWFPDLIARPLNAAVTELDAGERAAAAARGRGLDLWEAAADVAMSHS